MPYSKIFLCYFSCLLCIATIQTQNNTTEGSNNDTLAQISENINKNLKKQEDYVNHIASEAEKLYKNRQRELAHCQCSLHLCSTNFPSELKCYDKIRHDHAFCYKDTQEKIDPTRMGVILPPGTNPVNLTDRLKSSICTFKSIPLFYFLILYFLILNFIF